MLTFKGSNQPSQSFLVCDLALHRPVNQRAASSSLSQISWGPHPPPAFQGSSQATTSLPPAADLGTTRGRCCFRFPSLLVPAPRRASVPTPFPAHSWGPSAPSVPPNRNSLSCLASVSSRRSGQGRPILLPQPVSPRVQSPPPPRQEASTTQPFLPRHQRSPSNRSRRSHRRPGRYLRARRWP